MPSNHPDSLSNSDRLFHVSGEPGIKIFYPRPSPSQFEGLKDDVVFSISQKMLHNYLLPRDCPRVTWYAGEQTTEEDKAKFIYPGKATCVIAVESAWYGRLRNAVIYCYEFPAAGFELIDECAGYYISHQPVSPMSVCKIADVVSELFKHDVELRFMPSLISLAACVSASSLNFSLIRMRNAQS